MAKTENKLWTISQLACSFLGNDYLNGFIYYFELNNYSAKCNE